jgi:hypothetical protein
LTILREGERWKEMRTAVGKQTIPKNVQVFSSDFNVIYQRFTDYIRTAKGEELEMLLPIKLLFMESK